MKAGLKSGVVPCRDMASLSIMLKEPEASVFTGLPWDGCLVERSHKA